MEGQRPTLTLGDAGLNAFHRIRPLQASKRLSLRGLNAHGRTVAGGGRRCLTDPMAGSKETAHVTHRAEACNARGRQLSPGPPTRLFTPVYLPKWAGRELGITFHKDKVRVWTQVLLRGMPGSSTPCKV